MQHPTNKKTLLAEALLYAQSGWKIFPLHLIENGKCSCGKADCDSPGKHPIASAAPQGVYNATSDTDKIQTWWTRYPRANIGMATGKASGFFVLDVDLPEGAESLASLEAQNCKLPDTVKQNTGSGGLHLFFKIPANDEIKNSTSKVGLNLDIRGDGGYIVITPSRHVTGKSYAWQPGHGPEEIEIAEAPQWLIDLSKSKPKSPKRDLLQSTEVSFSPETSPYGLAALEGEIQALHVVPEGQRNDALNCSAFKIGQLVSGGEISLSKAENTLQNTGVSMGLPKREVQATVKSGLKNGMENPRSATETSSTLTVADKSEPPRPLVREIPPGGEYPVEALGPVLGDTVRAIVDIVQVPPALAAGSVLAVASLATQGHANVVLPFGEGHPKPLSLYLVTIAHSSDRKSTVDDYALRAVKEFEAELSKGNQAKFQDYQNAKAAYDRARSLVLKGARKNATQTKETIASSSQELSALGTEPHPPLLPFIIVQEPTIEGLARLFLEGQPSLGLFSTEGAQMITGYGMRDERKLTTAGGLSLLWDGETLKRNRIGDGNYALPGKRLSLHLMVQPEVAMRLLSDPELKDQGLISRILVAFPASLAGTRMRRNANPQNLAVIDIFKDEITSRFMRKMTMVEGRRNELKPRKLRLSPEADIIWSSFSDEIEKEIGPGGKYEQIKAFAGKLAEQAARMAGIITLMEDFDATEISAMTMQNGGRLARYYAGEALRLFNSSLIEPDLWEAEKLRQWLLERDGELICLPDIYQFGPSSIRAKKIAKTLAIILVDHGWLIPIPEGALIDGSHRREVWRIVRL
jgi:hypothetical protein